MNTSKRISPRPEPTSSMNCEVTSMHGSPRCRSTRPRRAFDRFGRQGELAMKTSFLTILKLCVLVALANFTYAQPSGERIARDVTIYRDTYGVPHVFGGTDAS